MFRTIHNNQHFFISFCILYIFQFVQSSRKKNTIVKLNKFSKLVGDLNRIRTIIQYNTFIVTLSLFCHFWTETLFIVPIIVQNPPSDSSNRASTEECSVSSGSFFVHPSDPLLGIGQSCSLSNIKYTLLGTRFSYCMLSISSERPCPFPSIILLVR